MKCLDCHPIDSDAVAVCGRCGAGLCIEHVVETHEPLTFAAPIAAQIAADPPARKLRCGHCAAAEYAQRHHLTADWRQEKRKRKQPQYQGR